jgi:streptogrisin B
MQYACTEDRQELLLYEMGLINMKFAKRLVIILHAMSLALGCFIFTASAAEQIDKATEVKTAISEYEESIYTSIGSARMENESIANAQYNMLLDSMRGVSDVTSLEDCMVYPEYYGGSYIDEDGNLVVCVTNSAPEEIAIADIHAAIGATDIQTKRVQYSYSELYSGWDEISQIMLQLSSGIETENYAPEQYIAAELISSVYIKEDLNTVIVEISDIDDVKIDAVKEAFPDMPFLSFEEGYTTVNTATAWKPGAGLYTSTGNGLSTGYPVYFTTSSGEKNYGFVSAGHGFSTGNYAYISSGGTVLAQCVSSQDSGTVDAAVMKITNSSYTMSAHTTYNSITLTAGGYTIPATGGSVFKEGATTGLTAGTVTSLNSTYSDDHTDMIRTSALNLRGDSGGVMYAISGNNRLVVGSMVGSNHSGSALTESSFNYSIVCKVGNAMSALGFTLS